MTTDFSDTRRASGAASARRGAAWEIRSILGRRKHESGAEGQRPPILELLSFLIVGGGAALGFIGLSTLMIELLTGIPDWIVSACCYALFIVPVYLAHRHYSFRSGAPHAVALPRYVAIQLGALVLAALFSYVCYSVVGMPTAVAAILVVGLTSGVNFVVLKLWAFAHRG